MEDPDVISVEDLEKEVEEDDESKLLRFKQHMVHDLKAKIERERVTPLISVKHTILLTTLYKDIIPHIECLADVKPEESTLLNIQSLILQDLRAANQDVLYTLTDRDKILGTNSSSSKSGTSSSSILPPPPSPQIIVFGERSKEHKKLTDVLEIESVGETLGDGRNYAVDKMSYKDMGALETPFVWCHTHTDRIKHMFEYSMIQQACIMDESELTRLLQRHYEEHDGSSSSSGVRLLPRKLPSSVICNSSSHYLFVKLCTVVVKDNEIDYRQTNRKHVHSVYICGNPKLWANEQNSYGLEELDYVLYLAIPIVSGLPDRRCNNHPMDRLFDNPCNFYLKRLYDSLSRYGYVEIHLDDVRAPQHTTQYNTFCRRSSKHTLGDVCTHYTDMKSICLKNGSTLYAYWLRELNVSVNLYPYADVIRVSPEPIVLPIVSGEYRNCETYVRNRCPTQISCGDFIYKRDRQLQQRMFEQERAVASRYKQEIESNKLQRDLYGYYIRKYEDFKCENTTTVVPEDVLQEGKHELVYPPLRVRVHRSYESHRDDNDDEDDDESCSSSSSRRFRKSLEFLLYADAATLEYPFIDECGQLVHPLYTIAPGRGLSQCEIVSRAGVSIQHQDTICLGDCDSQVPLFVFRLTFNKNIPELLREIDAVEEEDDYAEDIWTVRAFCELPPHYQSRLPPQRHPKDDPTLCKKSTLVFARVDQLPLLYKSVFGANERGFEYLSTTPSLYRVRFPLGGAVVSEPDELDKTSLLVHMILSSSSNSNNTERCSTSLSSSATEDFRIPCKATLVLLPRKTRSNGKYLKQLVMHWKYKWQTACDDSSGGSSNSSTTVFLDLTKWKRWSSVTVSEFLAADVVFAPSNLLYMTSKLHRGVLSNTFSPLLLDLQELCFSIKRFAKTLATSETCRDIKDQRLVALRIRDLFTQGLLQIFMRNSLSPTSVTTNLHTDKKDMAGHVSMFRFARVIFQESDFCSESFQAFKRFQAAELSRRHGKHFKQTFSYRRQDSYLDSDLLLYERVHSENLDTHLDGIDLYRLSEFYEPSRNVYARRFSSSISSISSISSLQQCSALLAYDKIYIVSSQEPWYFSMDEFRSRNKFSNVVQVIPLPESYPSRQEELIKTYAPDWKYTIVKPTDASHLLWDGSGPYRDHEYYDRLWKRHINKGYLAIHNRCLDVVGALLSPVPKALAEISIDQTNIYQLLEDCTTRGPNFLDTCWDCVEYPDTTEQQQVTVCTDIVMEDSGTTGAADGAATSTTEASVAVGAKRSASDSDIARAEYKEQQISVLRKAYLEHARNLYLQGFERGDSSNAPAHVATCTSNYTDVPAARYSVVRVSLNSLERALYDVVENLLAVTTATEERMLDRDGRETYTMEGMRLLTIVCECPLSNTIFVLGPVVNKIRKKISKLSRDDEDDESGSYKDDKSLMHKLLYYMVKLFGDVEYNNNADLDKDYGAPNNNKEEKDHDDLLMRPEVRQRLDRGSKALESISRLYRELKLLRRARLLYAESLDTTAATAAATAKRNKTERWYKQLVCMSNPGVYQIEQGACLLLDSFYELFETCLRVDFNIRIERRRSNASQSSSSATSPRDREREKELRKIEKEIDRAQEIYSMQEETIKDLVSKVERSMNHYKMKVLKYSSEISRLTQTHLNREATDRRRSDCVRVLDILTKHVVLLYDFSRDNIRQVLCEESADHDRLGNVSTRRQLKMDPEYCCTLREECRNAAEDLLKEPDHEGRFTKRAFDVSGLHDDVDEEADADVDMLSVYDGEQSHDGYGSHYERNLAEDDYQRQQDAEFLIDWMDREGVVCEDSYSCSEDHLFASLPSPLDSVYAIQATTRVHTQILDNMDVAKRQIATNEERIKQKQTKIQKICSQKQIYRSLQETLKRVAQRLLKNTSTTANNNKSLSDRQNRLRRIGIHYPQESVFVLEERRSFFEMLASAHSSGSSGSSSCATSTVDTDFQERYFQTYEARLVSCDETAAAAADDGAPMNVDNLEEDDDEALWCDICCSSYDDKRHRLVLTPCLHTCCLTCIHSVLVLSGNKKCFMCRKPLEMRDVVLPKLDEDIPQQKQQQQQQDATSSKAKTTTKDKSKSRRLEPVQGSISSSSSVSVSDEFGAATAATAATAFSGDGKTPPKDDACLQRVMKHGTKATVMLEHLSGVLEQDTSNKVLIVTQCFDQLVRVCEDVLRVEMPPEHSHRSFFSVHPQAEYTDIYKKKKEMFAKSVTNPWRRYSYSHKDPEHPQEEQKVVLETPPRILVSCLESLPDGMELPEFSHIFFISQPFWPSDLERRQYIISCVRRVGNSRKTVEIVDFVCKDTVDESLYRVFMRKSNLFVD